MKDIEKIIREVDGTMTIEGMPITEADKKRIRTGVSSADKFESTLKELIAKHSSGVEKAHEQRLQLQ